MWFASVTPPAGGPARYWYTADVAKTVPGDPVTAEKSGKYQEQPGGPVGR